MHHVKGPLSVDMVFIYHDIYHIETNGVDTYLFYDMGQYVIRSSAHASPMLWDYADTLESAITKFNHHIEEYHN